MYNLFQFLIKQIKLKLRIYYLQYRAYKVHGISLPIGAILYKPEAIEIGNNFNLGTYCTLYCQDPEKGSKILIGNNVSLNYNVSLNADSSGEIVIGDDVLIGPMTIFRASNHNFDSIDLPIRKQGHTAGKIVIENNVWIGANVIVLPNVKIGESSIIGAGSIVTKDIPPFSIAVGNPAKVIRTRE